MHLTGGIALGLWSPAPTKKQCLVGAIPCGRPVFDQKSTPGEMHPLLERFRHALDVPFKLAHELERNLECRFDIGFQDRLVRVMREALG
jgi:hypothetical protein